MKNGIAVKLVLILMAAFPHLAWGSDAAGAARGAVLEAQAGNTGAPQRIHLEMSPTPPPMSAATERALAQRAERTRLPHLRPLAAGSTQVPRADSVLGATSETRPEIAAPAADAATSAAGTLTLFRDASLGAIIKTNTSGATGEPTAANAGTVVFATGNWWAALSTDGGQTYGYIDPSTQFPSAFGGFCCDQTVVYDPTRDIFIWSLQYNASGPAGTGGNAFRIAVASPAAAALGNWVYYTFNSAANTEWDYPDICVSNNFAYYTTNRGIYNSAAINDALVYRLPLDELAALGGVSFSSIDLAGANFSLKCARGATDVAYFGTHNTTSQVRIYRWPESVSSMTSNDVNLSAAWSVTAHTCPTPDGHDWCADSDGRILAGWIGRGNIGFLWNSGAIGTFTAPYVEGVVVDEPTRAYSSRPAVWNSSFAWHYPAAAANTRGDVGLSVHGSSISQYPSFYVGIADDYTRLAGAAWNVLFVRQGTQGPLTARWGDYFSVQAFTPNGYAWTATGTTMQGCGTAGCKETRYEVFGRARDLRAAPLAAPCSPDIDGNGTFNALTDGLMLIRAMFGLTGASVTAGAVGAGATRSSWPAIRGYLNGNCGTSFGP